ncbi:MAG: single-stranded-DNA-specific exonuclease RecJ [candidate division KSB1 bacterium]|nr:single-stranded-DNA-specific exonuclease RecJ [candidate division KSB1 bacterium]MDZ7334152.1 single-stranded-DNA-specific exonuclease RecJ [candidate division KSB1 bacterium]MDZ7401352.1 single-stranded-DNA-specific exonuclease RecJ [candidate division KSB1 bacterium]
MNLKWVLLNEYDKETVDRFAQQLHIPPIFSKILLSRGIDTYEKAWLFFRGNLTHLHDPFLLRDMNKAVQRILRAIQQQERILIYGDYDVDGITAVSMLYLLLKQIGADVHFYIPHRIREGYGISLAGIEEAARLGTRLIISVDCGVTAVREIEYAQQLNMDVIVSDHHEPGKRLPQAYAMLNPKCPESNYPFHELAGVGVAYKLAQALAQALDLDASIIEDFVDLVAIGSAADIVPLVDENRIFVKEGLKRLNQTTRPGLKALLQVAGLLNKPISTGQIVFIIAPRINAVGRMGNAERAIELFTTQDHDRALEIANLFETENRQRKNIDEETFKAAQQIIEDNYDLSSYYSLVVDQVGWHPGVIGIVASRLVEKYYRPTVMISVDENIGKGSARSISGFDIYLALKQCEDLLIGFGGHKYAAGLTIARDKIDAFRQRFNEISQQQLTEDLLCPKLRIDGEIRLSDINATFYKFLKLLAPFGPQNMRPVFLSQKLQVIGTPTIVGNNHLRFKVRQDGIVMDAIGFNLGDLVYRIEPGANNLDMAYVIEENTYLGRTTLQLRVKDLR